MLGLIKKDLYYLGTSWKVLFLSVLIIGWFSTSKGFGAILIIVLPTFFGLSLSLIHIEMCIRDRVMAIAIPMTICGNVNKYRSLIT